MVETEQIVFVDERGVPTGEVGPKLASHMAHTRRHLAFSCYIFRRSDRAFLMTQRALSKKVWPGVWTNSVCGHPAPDEAIEDAIRRRAAYTRRLQKNPDDMSYWAKDQYAHLMRVQPFMDYGDN